MYWNEQLSEILVTWLSQAPKLQVHLLLLLLVVGDVGLIPCQEYLLEKEMATPSSILAWRIPWTEGS